MSPRSAFAIDISSAAVKALKLTSHKKSGYEVVSAIRRPYDSKPALAEAVKKILSELQLDSPVVGTSVWASTMVVRKIGLPRLKPAEVAGALQLEADKYVPFGLDECIMDHYIFPQDVQGTKMDVMLIASKKDLILERCRFFEESALKPAFIDIHPIAVVNWFLKRRPESAKGTRVLVHIGDVPGKAQGEDNFLTIVRDGVPWVIRDLGDRLAAGLTDEACGQLGALLSNAIVFYENLAHEKPKEIILSADDTVAAKIGEAFEKIARIPVVRWKSGDALEFANDGVRKEFEGFPGVFTVALGIGARMLES